MSKKVKPVRAWIVQAGDDGQPDMKRLRYVAMYEDDYLELMAEIKSLRRQAKAAKKGKVKRGK